MRISARPKNAILSAREFSPASLQTSEVICTEKDIPSALNSVGTYFCIEVFFDISDMYVSTGDKMLIDKTKTEIVIKILMNNEYSSLIFLKIIQITREHKTMPQTLISFIRIQKHGREVRTSRLIP